MLKLYYARGTCALAPHIALEEAQADYQVERIDFAKNEQRSPAYLAINAKGRVPALITERGTLTEAPALLLYIAQLHPAARLAPLDDTFALARMQEFNSYLCSTVHVAHGHRQRGARWSDDEAAHKSMAAKVPQNMRDCFTLIEREYLVGPWVMGEAYSVADAYLFTISRWLAGDSVDLREFPRAQAHFDRVAARPAVQKVMALHA